MKELLIVGMGCFPLLWFTFAELRDWRQAVKTPAAASDVSRLDLNVMLGHVDRVSREAGDESVFVESFAVTDPFTEKLRELPSSKPKLFAELSESWHRYTQARGTALRVVSVYANGRWPEHDEEANLKSIVDSLRDGGLPNSKQIETWCENRRDAIKKSETLTATLEAIRSNFRKENYDATLTRLEQLSKDSLSSDEKLEMKGIERQARFKRHWKDFPRAPIPTVLADTKRRITNLEKRLANYPSLLDENDEEVETRKTLVEDRKKELEELRCRLRIDVLFESPHVHFTHIASESAPILQEYGTQPRLQEKVKKWVEDRLQEKKIPKFEHEESEAWHVSGTYRRGIFKQCSNFDAKPVDEQFYRYWVSFNNFKNGRPIDEEVYVKDLKDKPSEMLEVLVCRGFNNQRINVLNSLGSKTAPDEAKDTWRKFAESCEDKRIKIVDYYTKVMPEKQDISFKAEAQLTDEIMKEWDIVERIFYSDR